MLAGALTPTLAFADGCAPVTFFGMDPWYAGLTCSDGKNIDQSQFNSDNIGSTVGKIIGVVVKDLLFAVGIVAVVMIIVGGAQYILSSGNPTQVAKATKTITGSIIGLIIAVLAYAIATAVLKLVGIGA